MFQMVFSEDGTVNAAYKAVRISQYAKHLRRWLAVFPTESIHVVDGDALVTDPFPEVERVERYLSKFVTLPVTYQMN